MPLLKSIVWELFWRFFSFFLNFKVTIIENVSFTDYASGMRLSDCSRLAINWKNNNNVTIFRHDIIVNIFKVFFVSLVNFSYWSKFFINIITVSGFMTIFFYKGLTITQKSEIPLSEFCPISGDWDKLEIPNLIRMFLVKHSCQG